MTDLTISAIPTLYNGILYRSRTEARWAKFWDELGIIDRDYEPQGFVTTTGKPYLPDFMIKAAGGRLWVEIKGSWESDPQGIAKFRTFAAERPYPSDSRAVLLTGAPTLDGKFLVIGGNDDQDDPLKGVWEDDTQQWRPCGSGDHFDLAYPGLFRAKFAVDDCADNFGGNGETRLRDAVSAALSARFGTHEPTPTGV